MNNNLEWDNEDSLRLLDLYEKHAVLWNPRHSYYYNKSKKQKAWEMVAQACGVPMSEVKRKMESLLSSFRRERCKVRKKQKAMDGMNDTRHREYVSRWFAFKKMSFLLDKEEPKEFIDYDDDISVLENVEQITGDSTQADDDSLLFAVEAVYDPDPTVVADLEESSGASSQPSTSTTTTNNKHMPRECDRPKNSTPVPKPNVPFKTLKGIKRSASDSEEDSRMDIGHQSSTTARADIGHQSSTTARADIGHQSSTSARADIGHQSSTTSRTDIGHLSSIRERVDISEAVDILKSAAARIRKVKRDDSSTYGEHIANKLRGYDKRTRAIVEHHINNIMFQADMGDFKNTTNSLSMQSTSQICSQRTLQSAYSQTNIDGINFPMIY